jgi:small subunit ribosomal protein S16
MLKIRMQRIGRIKQASFRIVVVEHTSGPKAGKVVEQVGSYNPKTKERTIKAERVNYWMSVGAKLSDTMHNMLISADIIKGTKKNVLPKNKNKPTPTPAATAVVTTPAAEAVPM